MHTIIRYGDEHYIASKIESYLNKNFHISKDFLKKIVEIAKATLSNRRIFSSQKQDLYQICIKALSKEYKISDEAAQFFYGVFDKAIRFTTRVGGADSWIIKAALTQ